MQAQQQLQEHLARLRAGEPIIPLLPGQAVAQATRLRLAGLTYADVARVMGIYHGDYRSAVAWNRAARRAGAPPARWAVRDRVPPHLMPRALEARR